MILENASRSSRYSENIKLEDKECNICKSTEKLEKHRIQPREFGGRYVSSNVIVVCQKCHNQIHKFINNARGNLDEYQWIDFVIATKNYLEMKKEFEDGSETSYA